MKRFGILLLAIILLLAACNGAQPSAPFEDGTQDQEPGSIPSAVPQQQSTPEPIPTAAMGSQEIQSVRFLFPLNGAVFETTIVEMTWYVVPNAAQYRVQLAADPGFEKLNMDVVLYAPPKATNPLPAGNYYWRVQAVAADGSAAPFSPVSQFEVLSAQSSAAGSNLYLDVPFLNQNKDSAMLLLESVQETGSHAWNQAHTSFNPADPADQANSGLACIAMLNQYYGGNLTQDRLGYEIFKDLQPGPERDLPYGVEPNKDELNQLLAFALAGEQIAWEAAGSQSDRADFNAWIIQQIDHGRPVFAAVPGHHVLVTGYASSVDPIELWLNDPAAGIYRLKSAQMDWLWAYSFDAPQPAMLEENLLLDTDEDGVLDFDEIERFTTDPTKPDSDADGIMDGDEIRASMFDPQYGYAFSGDLTSRDLDQDGKPMELDIDSDNGGCLDGFEDNNRDGIFRPVYGETWNFDPQDDRCYALHMTWDFEDKWGKTTIEWNGSFDVDSFQKISGNAVALLEHNGVCINSRLNTAMRLRGSAEQGFQIQFEPENPFDLGTYSTDTLPEGCSMGLAVEENWAVSNSIYSGMLPVFEIAIPSAGEEITAYFDPPETSARHEQMQMMITYIRPK